MQEAPVTGVYCLYPRGAFGCVCCVLLYILLLSQVTVVKLKRTKLLLGKITEPIMCFQVTNFLTFCSKQSMEGEPACSHSFWGLSHERLCMVAIYIQTCHLPKVVKQLLGWVMSCIDWLETYLATRAENTVEEWRVRVMLLSFRVQEEFGKFVLVLSFILVQF